MSVPARRFGVVHLLLAAILALTTVTVSGPQAANAAGELLPDLMMAAPYNVKVQVKPNGKRLLRFGTIVWNVGEGPLEVRANTRVGNTMTRVVQRVRSADGPVTTVIPGMTATYSGDGHNHWHINAFITISLFSKDTGEAVDPVALADRGLRKIGFCLTDLVRAPASLRPSNAASRVGFPVIGCGTRASQEFTMGISPGYGDDYKPFFNHQWIDVVGLETGTYRMCATVNSTGMWQEKDQNLANNSSWLDVEIDAQRSRMTVVASDDTDCEKPPPIWFGVGA